jgi:nucleotide-binding universal stress UspA family protein
VQPLTGSGQISVRKFLFATDFSETSLPAVPYAEAVAALYGAKGYVAHVAGNGTFPVLPPQEQKKLLQQAEDEMNHFLRAAASGTRCERIVRGGDAATVLYELGRELGIDLLILGTHGRRGVKRFVLGSVAEELFRLMPCPVLTVGPEAKVGVTATAKPQHVLFPTDFEASSLQALPCATQLARQHHSVLTLMHVASARQTVQEAEARLRALLPTEAPSQLSAEVLVRVGSPADTIVKEAETKKSDLIVLGVRGKGSWDRAATHAPGPVAYNVVAKAPCPVLTVRS